MKIWKACVILIGYFLMSCDKSTDDELTGKWQLESCEISAGDFRQADSVFYNFDRGVFRLQVVESFRLKDSRFGMYTLYGDSLYMELTDPAYRDKETLKLYYGWTDVSRRFLIREVGRKRLQLSCGDTLYLFRKF